MLSGFFRWEFVRLIVGLLKDARFFLFICGVTSWGRKSAGEDVAGTPWGRMSEGGNPRERKKDGPTDDSKRLTARSQ